MSTEAAPTAMRRLAAMKGRRSPEFAADLRSKLVEILPRAQLSLLPLLDELQDGRSDVIEFAGMEERSAARLALRVGLLLASHKSVDVETGHRIARGDIDAVAKQLGEPNPGPFPGR